MKDSSKARLKFASRCALSHLCASIIVVAFAATLVLLVWYPSPYDLLSGGRALFLLLAMVDMVCGPLLTLILLDPQKSRRALWTDVSMVALIQLGALSYGLHAAYSARPIFLVHEVDRFRVITVGDYGGADVHEAIAQLEPSLQPFWLKGPVVVGIRTPQNLAERSKVLAESIAGGRDYSQRPEFYIPYDDAYRSKVLARAQPLDIFLNRYSKVKNDAARLLKKHQLSVNEVSFLPVLHKQDWIAVLDKSARILGFLPGDGFNI